MPKFKTFFVLILSFLLISILSLSASSLSDADGYVYDETQRYDSNWSGYSAMYNPTSTYKGYYLGANSTDFDKVLTWTDSSIEASVSGDGVLTFSNLDQNTAVKLNSPNSAVVQAKPVYFSFEIYFDSSFTGMKFCYQTTTNLISIEPNGNVLLQSGDESGFVLSEGWNTIVIYDFPTISNEKVTAHQNYLYVAKTCEVMGTNGVSKLHLNKMVAFNWNTSTVSVSFGRCNNLNFIWNTSSASKTSFQIKNIHVVNLNEGNGYSCTVSDESIFSYSYGIKEVTLPTSLNDGSLFVDTLERMYLAGESITLNRDVSISPLKLTQGTMVLASSYSLNLKVKIASANFSLEQICVSDGVNTYLGSYSNSDGAYVFSIKNISAAQFAEEKHYTISILADGKTYTSSQSTTYSPYIYATRMYKKSTTSASLKNLLVALVQYADAAQGSQSTILDTFCANVGIDVPSCSDVTLNLPSTNREEISSHIQVGAVLSESVALVVSADGCTSVNANNLHGTTYLKINNLGPGNLYTVFSISVEKDSQNYQGTYSIATYLDSIMQTYGDETEIGHLARATAVYMLAAAAYAN